MSIKKCGKDMKLKQSVLWLAAATLSTIFLYGCGKAAPGSSGAGDESARQVTHSLTVMVYMVGSDLETDGGAATSDISEMQSACADGQADVLLYTGGAEKWWNDIPANQNSVYLLGGKGMTSVHQTAALNMGAPATLTDFLDYAYQNYPADAYALVLWDHGAGPIEGYGFDELYEYDRLTLSEMHQALQNSALSKAGAHLSWVGFDACLMCSIETANVLSDFSDYMIASQEAVPNQGWDYSFLSAPIAELADGKTAAYRIIDAYADFYDQQNAALTNSKKIYTLSCLDLSKMDAANNALNGFFSTLNKTILPDGYSKIAQKRSSMPVFGRFTLGQYSDLIDLKQFASLTGDLSSDASGALIAAVDDAVVYSRTNQEDANGVSIFFPYDNSDYLKLDDQQQFDWQSVYDQIDASNTYPAFLSNFSRIRTGNSMTSWRGESAPTLGQDIATQSYFLQLSDEQAANFETAAVYVVSHVKGDEYVFLQMGKNYTLDPSNRVFANFSDRMIYVTNASGEKMIPWVYEQETVGDVVRYGTIVLLSRYDYDERGEVDLSTFEYLSCDLAFERNRTTNQITIASITPSESEEDKPTGKQEVDLSDWNTIEFLSPGRFLTRDDNGDMLPFIQWETSSSMYLHEYDIQDGFQLEYLPIENENAELFCLITVRDTQRNLYTSPLLPLNNTASAAPDAAAKQAPLSTAPLVVPYNVNSSGTVTVYDDENIAIDVVGLRYNEEYQSLDVSLTARKKKVATSDYSLLGVSANQYLLDVGVYLFFEQSDTKDFTISLPVANSLFGPSMQSCAIDSLNSITFFVCNKSRAVLRRVQLDTNFDPKPYFETFDYDDSRSLNETPQTLYQKEGLSVSLEDVRISSGSSYLYVDLFIQNNGIPLSGLEVNNVSVSGVMVDTSEIVYDPIATGMKRYGSFTIDLDELGDFGVTAINDISFSIQPQAFSFDEPFDRIWVSLVSGDHGFAPSDLENRKPGLNTDSAKVVVDQGGIRILMLPNDPNGFQETLFVIYNETDTLVNVSGQDEMLNGEATNDIFLYFPTIAPGKCAVTPLNGSDALLANGGVFSMRFFVKDVDRNTLLLASEPIEVKY